MAKKGYKVFDKNWCCRGFQYEVGKTYTHEGEITLCTAGFHFCENLIDCFDYYPFNKEMNVAEIIARGDIITNGKKSVTNIIDIVRELDWSEVLKIVNFGIDNNGRGNTGDKNTGDRNIGYYNTGDYNTGDSNTGDCNTGHCNTGDCNTGYSNTGDCNTGDRNTGERNTGDRNTGDYNTGYCNTGDRNTGDSNAGDRNTGYCNTGDFNTGYCNTGDYNTGDYNTGDYNTGMWNHTSYSSGYFNTCESPLIVFNQPVNMTRDEFLTLLGVRLIKGLCKDNYKVFATKNAQKWYDALSPQNKQAIKDIPNFNAEIFKQITGIDVESSN